MSNLHTVAFFRVRDNESKKMGVAELSRVPLTGERVGVDGVGNFNVEWVKTLITQNVKGEWREIGVEVYLERASYGARRWKCIWKNRPTRRDGGITSVEEQVAMKLTATEKVVSARRFKNDARYEKLILQEMIRIALDYLKFRDKKCPVGFANKTTVGKLMNFREQLYSLDLPGMSEAEYKDLLCIGLLYEVRDFLDKLPFAGNEEYIDRVQSATAPYLQALMASR